MSESGDYTPAPHWKGYDFGSARRAYKDVVATGAKAAVAAGIDGKTLVPASLDTDCESPLSILIDVTGSMGDWPATIFSKLPYLEHEGKEYLGKDMRISFAAVGDCNSDKYPLQVQPFVGGAEMEASLKKLVIEGNGGGQSCESYDIAGLYYLRNVTMKKAIRKPILIFIGDEGVYNAITADHALNWAKTELKERMTIEAMFKELCKKYAVYCVRRPYGGVDVDSTNAQDQNIQKQWEGLVGADHVVRLADPNRVVDVIFGILAKETARLDYFEKELTDRQMKDADGKAKIGVVMKSLKSIRSPDSVKKLPPPSKAKSVTRRSKKSDDDDSNKNTPKSIGLLDD